MASRTVLHVITTTDLGGAETMLERLVLNRQSELLRPVVISLLPVGPLGRTLKEFGVELYSLNLRKDLGAIPAWFRFRSLLLQIRPDIVVSWLYHADMFATTAKLSLGSSARWPLIWNLRSSARVDSKGLTRVPVLHRALGRASRIPNAIIVNSVAGLHYHQQIGYRPSRWHVVPNGVDTRKFKPDHSQRLSFRHRIGVDASARLIALPARYHPVKGHEVFLEAAAALAVKRPDVVFLLIGEVPSTDPELRAHCRRLGLEGKVLMIGPCRSMELVYPALDIVSLSSWSEGFPNVLVEAMSCGVPCVATDVGDIRAVLDGVGIVIPPGNPHALSEGWESVLNLDSTQADYASRNCRLRVQELYSLTKVVDRYETILLNCLACRGVDAQ